MQTQQMTRKHRHLLAAVSFAALASLCFGLLTWALVEGSVIANFSGDARVQSDTAGHQYRYASTVYSREAAPGRYWLVIGLLGFFGSLFAVLAVLERGSHRTAGSSRKGENPSPDLLAEIDRTCELYPEGRDILLRAKAVMAALNDPTVDVALDGFLEKIRMAPTREEALRGIQSLEKGLDLYRSRSN